MCLVLKYALTAAGAEADPILKNKAYHSDCLKSKVSCLSYGVGLNVNERSGTFAFDR